MPLIVPPPTDQKKLCKAWIRFNGTGTVSIYNHFNVDSIVDYGVGNYGIIFDKQMANSDYSCIVSAEGDAMASNNHSALNSTTQSRVLVFQCSTGASQDRAHIYCVIFGDQ